jgi:hypothetical protein
VKVIAELRHIPMKENLGMTPVWLGSSNHSIQPATIVNNQPMKGKINMQWPRGASQEFPIGKS